MQSLRIRPAIGAAATLANILSGTSIEYIGRPAVLRIWGNGDIAGMSHQVSFNMGSEPSQLPVPTSSLQTATTAGAVKVDEDAIIEVAVPAGARLVHSVTNPGAASNVTFLYEVR